MVGTQKIVTAQLREKVSGFGRLLTYSNVFNAGAEEKKKTAERNLQNPRQLYESPGIPYLGQVAILRERTTII